MTLGLKCRQRKGGTVWYWIPPAKDIAAGYRPKSIRLTETTAVAREARCIAMQKDLEVWRSKPTPRLSRKGAFRSQPIHQTPIYRARAAYQNMKRRCLNADGRSPTYQDVELRMSLDEWLTWAVPRYERFIKTNPTTKPSVSRKGDAGHYEIGNIEIVSVLQNLKDQKRRGR